MKISDFGLSRDVYEEDSYVKRSKVRFSLEIGRSQTVISAISVYIHPPTTGFSLAGPYSCQVDGYRVVVRSHLHNAERRVSTVVAIICGALDDFIL